LNQKQRGNFVMTEHSTLRRCVVCASGWHRSESTLHIAYANVSECYGVTFVKWGVVHEFMSVHVGSESFRSGCW
jgi:hypothetical protein